MRLPEEIGNHATLGRSCKWAITKPIVVGPTRKCRHVCRDKQRQQHRFALRCSVEPWESAQCVIEEAATPPSSWYQSESVLKQEMIRIFQSKWIFVGHLGCLKDPGRFLTGTYIGMPYLIARSMDGQLHAFHNVCRHHAAAVASGCGVQDCFECPYHGWTYGLDGRLRRAPQVTGIRNFDAANFGLKPIRLETWGHLVFLNFSNMGEGLEEQIGHRGLEAMHEAGMADDSLVHVASRHYHLKCNWKVFCDNYLDGGYHVSVAHPQLADGLDMSSYRSTIYESVSIQSCNPKTAAPTRLGERQAAYAFVYPNFMVNRYGPWMDTNLVLPCGPDSCTVHFDYWLHHSLAHNAQLIADSLASSDQVQQEDTGLCEAVQRGLHSPAYDTGRYAPGLEQPMFHFHQLLHHDLIMS